MKPANTRKAQQPWYHHPNDKRNQPILAIKLTKFFRQTNSLAYALLLNDYDYLLYTTDHKITLVRTKKKRCLVSRGAPFQLA
jgi:hypothetical protein